MKNRDAAWLPINQLEACLPNGNGVNTVIETPKGSRNKYKYEPDLGLFTLHKVLPAGAVFPYDFGFIPSTIGQDGDPLDVLILMDQPVFTGCLTQVRLIGVIEAEQTEDGKTIRNDRMIAVAEMSKDNQDLTHIDQMEEHLLKEIEHFFISYDEMEGKEFKPVGQRGPKRAMKLIQKGVSAYKKRNS